MPSSQPGRKPAPWGHEPGLHLWQQASGVHNTDMHAHLWVDLVTVFPDQSVDYPILQLSNPSYRPDCTEFRAAPPPPLLSWNLWIPFLTFTLL